ncbi:MAG: cupin domain-containing protein [Ahrensia sp.]|nr:cupin domain-containing protein [Ahrensia sp.]
MIDPSWFGKIEGRDIGTQATILFFSTEEIGDGPPLHTHTYDELFLIGSGRARFTVGETSFVAERGDVVFGPAHIPHKFENLGPDPFQTTDIHLSDHFEQVELE